MKARVIPRFAPREPVRVYTSAGWLLGRVESQVSAKVYRCWVCVDPHHQAWQPMNCPVDSLERGWPQPKFPYSAWEMQHTEAGRQWARQHGL